MLKRGNIVRGAFGGFPTSRKCENPQTPTQSAVRAKAIYSVFGVQCLVIRYAWVNWFNSVCTSLLIQNRVEKKLDSTLAPLE